MVDFHNHFLPNVDDGPKDIEESIKMLKYAYEQGITKVVQTVHFQHPKMYKKNIEYSYLYDILKKVQSRIDEMGINIKLYLSAEVFYLPNLVEISKNPVVTLGDSKYMLIEFATSLNPVGYEDQFYKLQMSGITPIVAHPERYRFIQNNIDIIDEWIERGYKIQVDAGSILGLFGKKVKDITLQIINKGNAHLIGSDAHNNRKRNFCLKAAYTFIDDNISSDYVLQLKKNADNIINELEIDSIYLDLDIKKNKLSDLWYRFFKLLKLI